MTYVRKGYNMGEDRWSARLKMADVAAIRRGEFGTDREAAKALKVSHVAVWYARVGRTWKSCKVPPVRSSDDLKSLHP